MHAVSCLRSRSTEFSFGTREYFGGQGLRSVADAPSRYGVVFAQSIGVGEPFTINTIIYVVQIVTVGASVVLGNKMNRRTNL